MKFPPIAAGTSLFVLLTSCVTTLSPPKSNASPQQPAAGAATPQTAQIQAANIGSGTVRPVYLLGSPPAGKGQPRSASPAQMKQAMAKLAPSKARNSDKAIFTGGGYQRANNWMRQFDFSGIAWDSPRTATLVSDRHVLMAAHYDRKRGDRITFHDRHGHPVTRTIAAVKRGPVKSKNPFPDVSIGRLSQPVPDTVTFYPIIPAQDYKTLLMHQDMLVTNMRKTVDRYNILSVYHSTSNDMIRSGNMTKLNLDRSWGGNLVAGDSGNPVFIVVGGQLVIVGTNTFGGGGSNGPFFGGPQIQKFIRDGVTELERSFQ